MGGVVTSSPDALDGDHAQTWYDALVRGDYDADALLSAEEDAHLSHARPSAEYYQAVRAAYDFLVSHKGE